MLSITPVKFVSLSHCDSSRGRIKTNDIGIAITSANTIISGISIFGDLIADNAGVLHHRLYSIHRGFTSSNKLDVLIPWKVP